MRIPSLLLVAISLSSRSVSFPASPPGRLCPVSATCLMDCGSQSVGCRTSLELLKPRKLVLLGSVGWAPQSPGWTK